MSTSLDLGMRGLGRVLRLTDCPEVRDALEAVMPGWPLEVSDAVGLPPAIRLHPEGAGYQQRAPALGGGLFLPTPVSAACSLVADLVEAFFAGHPALVGLHCGSVEIDGRLVVFPESHRAGKSTLTAALAAAGQRVFGDDVLALTPAGDGMALGIAPRLRLPLPTCLDPALQAFAAQYAGPEDERYRFLALPEGRLARHGECRPLGALVLLERDASLVAPELIDLAPGEGLLQLLCQNFAHEQPSEALMARFLPLMEALPCRLLRYGEPLAAARHLVAAVRDEARPGALSPLGQGAMMPGGATAAADDRWRASTAVRDYPLGDELFLIESGRGAIHRLNTSGRLIWGLLCEEAMSGGEIAELLADHYGTAAREAIEADVLALLGGLAGAGLIAPA